MQYVIQKSYVQAHERKLKSGKVVQILAHYDKRTKKHTEHAPEHGHDDSHLSGDEKDLFSRMHREQHFMAHYHATGYRKMASHHESRASELEAEAVEHEKSGRKKRASKLRDSAAKHREKSAKYHDAAGKMDKIVQGIGALKEKLVAGSGKLAEEDTDAAHARYAEKAGHKFKTLAPKQAAPSAKPTESGHAEGDKWVMPLKAAVEEHKELVHAAETPTKADDKAQLVEQKAELARMESNSSPLSEAQRKSIEQSNSAWEAWKSGVETPSRAAFREQARSGKLDHLYALAEEDKRRINAETEQRQAEAKQRQKAKNDAWRERNLPRLAAAKKVSEDFERGQQAAKVAAAKARLDAEQAKKVAAEQARLEAMRAKTGTTKTTAPKRTLPKTGRVSNDDPSIWGSWLLGHEGESWSSVRTLAPAHLQDGSAIKEREQSAPSVVVRKEVADEIQAKNDRNTMTFGRPDKNGDIQKVTFSRGDKVKVAVGKPFIEGEITGISHANNQIKVGGLWYERGYIYPADYDEFKKPREEINADLAKLTERLNNGNAIEANALIDNIKKKADFNNLGGEYKDRIDALYIRAIQVAAKNESDRKEKDKTKELESSQKQEAKPDSKPRQVIRMTMDEWKKVSRNYKGKSPDGTRMVMGYGGMQDVEIVKDAAQSSGGKLVNVDQSPREGERNAEGLVFRNGRWHREESANKTPESEWPQKRRDVISALKNRGWVIAPNNEKIAELLVDGHYVGTANLHMNFPEEILTNLTKRNPAWTNSNAAQKKYKVSGSESAEKIAENIDKMARAHHEVVAPPEKRTVLADVPDLNVATKFQGKDVVFTKKSPFGVIDSRAIAQYGEHLRDHKLKNGSIVDYRDATPDEVKASEKEAAKAAKKAAAAEKKAIDKFMNAPSKGYASFDEWYADADMPTKLEDGTWVDLETGLPYRAADTRQSRTRSGISSNSPKKESAPSAPVPQGLPAFADGKTKGAADYYVKIAQNLLEASKKPNPKSALDAEKNKTFFSKTGGLATAWASKTQNSKLLVDFYNKLFRE